MVAAPLPDQSERPREEALALQALDRTFSRLWRMIERQIADHVPLSRSEIRLLQSIPLGAGALAVERARFRDRSRIALILAGFVVATRRTAATARTGAARR
jgi:hypothetical protein